ncbi:MAG: hypothetical protein ACLGIO_06840 [Acidimicrobiia bacterium]
MRSDQGTIVVVEDDPNIADLVDLYLRREGWRVLQAADGGRDWSWWPGSGPGWWCSTWGCRGGSTAWRCASACGRGRPPPPSRW